MKLKSLVTYKSAFSLSKAITITAIAFAVIAPIAIMIYFNEKLDDRKNIIYVIDKDGDIVDAKATRQSEVRQYEYEDVVKDVFTWWYELDESSYKSNIDKALVIFDEVGKTLKDDYDAQNMLSVLREKNLQTKVKISEQDLFIDMQSDPVIGQIKGTQTWIRGENKVDVELIVAFELKDVNRGKGNAHGVKITRWQVSKKEIEQ